MLRKSSIKACAMLASVLIGWTSSTARAGSQAQTSNDPSPGEEVAIKAGTELVKVGIQQAWKAVQRLRDRHPCVLFDGEHREWRVPLLASTESRGTINFDATPLVNQNHAIDNALVRIEYVNFGRWTDIAVMQCKVDKPGRPDRDRGSRVKNGDITEIGVGPDEVSGFYFAIRDGQHGEKWNTQQVLAEQPSAYIRVTIVKQPAR